MCKSARATSSARIPIPIGEIRFDQIGSIGQKRVCILHMRREIRRTNRKKNIRSRTDQRPSSNGGVPYRTRTSTSRPSMPMRALRDPSRTLKAGKASRNPASLASATEWKRPASSRSSRCGSIPVQLSRTSLYQFFHHREDLLEALLGRWRDRNTGAIREQREAYAETIALHIANSQGGMIGTRRTRYSRTSQRQSVAQTEPVLVRSDAASGLSPIGKMAW